MDALAPQRAMSVVTRAADSREWARETNRAASFVRDAGASDASLAATLLVALLVVLVLAAAPWYRDVRRVYVRLTR